MLKNLDIPGNLSFRFLGKLANNLLPSCPITCKTIWVETHISRHGLRLSPGGLFKFHKYFHYNYHWKHIFILINYKYTDTFSWPIPTDWLAFRSVIFRTSHLGHLVIAYTWLLKSHVQYTSFILDCFHGYIYYSYPLELLNTLLILAYPT